MSINLIATLLLWIILPIVLLIVVPRHRLRESIAVFLFFQMLTWLLSIYLTYFGLLTSPYRIFETATKINFTSEFLVFPTAAVFFQLWYPDSSGRLRRIIHYTISVGGILLFMYLLGSITKLMTIKPDNLIRSAFNFTFELWLCRKYIVWLMNNPEASKMENEI
jgi:hypothetical protein